MKIKNVWTGIEGDYIEWDNVFSMVNRFWASCPVCGHGLTYPINGQAMAHKECMEVYYKTHQSPNGRVEPVE